MKDKTTKRHYEKYAKFYAVAPRSFDAMALSIIRSQTDGDPIENLRISYENDPHLNNTFRNNTFKGFFPNRFGNYDMYYDRTRSILRGVYSKTAGFSLAENVCVLKHAMICGLLKCEPEFHS
jgi:hypothetical protein